MFLKNFIITILGTFPDLKIFFKHRLLRIYDVLRACSLMVFVTLFETASVATFIPLLELLQSGDEINLDEDPSIWWKYFSLLYDFLGVELNILTLSISIVILVFLRQFFNYLNVVNLTTLIL